MEKTIESDISITNVVIDEVDAVVINDVPVSVNDVPVQVSESAIVDPNVVPNVVVVEVDHVQGEIR
jgi:hypothetical protein